MKILLIICDGMSDRPVNGKTPLETADIPHMDSIARKGITGIMDTVRAGIRPGSDTSHLSLFGYNPFDLYTGRGPFEALGVGLELKKGDVAIRCNFGTIKNGKVIDRRAGRDEYGLDKLAEELDGMKIFNTETIFRKASGHRAVLILKGKNLSANISDTDPESENSSPLPSKALDRNENSRRTARILNKFTEESIKILRDHPVNKKRVRMKKLPANIILARGAGIQTHLQPFNYRFRMNAACISATTLIKGVCRAVGMDIIEVKGATGHVDSNIAEKAKAAIKALKNYDFVFLHIKGTDETSHDGNFKKKVEMIERIDREVIAPILKNVRDTTICITADHSTPISIKQHSADPTPVAILGDVRTDFVKKFTERDCATGGLNRICGINLLNILRDLSNRTELFGA
ncbi:MAG TPA: 2,3-bisphosphoglycerate-independent phosphoglycerate mutase [Candidatus Altiarchaeales archaeon]|nr:2,3-bisphosphoglycerate-independent phosphoglycerate mutase [Candidatus Altiarchaeales archaeon]